jgi:hypothetical protein
MSTLSIEDCLRPILGAEDAANAAAAWHKLGVKAESHLINVRPKNDLKGVLSTIQNRMLDEHLQEHFPTRKGNSNNAFTHKNQCTCL